MDGGRPRYAALVLAAGAGSRYSATPGAKLLAAVEGTPVLGRVLGAVRAYRPAVTVVVLGHGAGDIERALEWHDEIRVRNHEPDRGLASSLQVGVDVLRALPEPLDGVFVVLGDQPWLRAETMQVLEAASLTAGDRLAVVPRYERGKTRNPVLLLRPAWSWVDRLEGDRGLGPLLEADPEPVLAVRVEGEMPDVDTPADLLGLDHRDGRP